MAKPEVHLLFNERELKELAQRPFTEILELPSIDYKIKYLVDQVKFLHIISGLDRIKPAFVYHQRPVELFNGDKLDLSPTKDQIVTWAIFHMNWCRFQNRAIPVEFLMHAASTARAVQILCITELSENLNAMSEPELYRKYVDRNRKMDSVTRILDEVEKKLYHEKDLFVFHWKQD